MSPYPQCLPMGNYLVNLQDIYQKVSGKYSYSMDIYEIRKSNLSRLIKEQFEGTQRRLADAIDRQPDYISRVLKGTKNVGEKLAREIEQTLGLSVGWLDTLHEYPQHEGGRADLKVSDSGKTYGGQAPVQVIGKPPATRTQGMFKDELEFFGHMDAWDSQTPLNEDEVELPLFREVELSAGAGATQVIENQGAKLRFAKSTLKRAGIPAEAAACAFVRGNSMEPVMPDGTCVGVNTADKAIKDGEIYAIDHGGMLRVKYLHRRPGGGIKIVSQNSSEHPIEELNAEEMAAQVRVIGRVFWWSVLR